MEEQDRSLWSGYKGVVPKGSPIPPIQQYSAKRSSYVELFRRFASGINFDICYKKTLIFG